MSEKCQRCGEEGEDRRTLWMACFYEMNELGIPFEQKILFHGDIKDMDLAKEATTLTLKDGHKINLGGGEVTCRGKLHPQRFYTLRVCKRCRSEWMETIANWFDKKPIDESLGTGIFIRYFGRNLEVTEEFYRYQESRGVPKDQIPPPVKIKQ